MVDSDSNSISNQEQKSVAVCLFGFLRNFHEKAESLMTKLIQPLQKEYQVYLYIYTPEQQWEDRTEPKVTLIDLKNAYPLDDHLIVRQYPYDIEKIKNLVPKAMPELTLHSQKPWRILSQFYHIQQSIGLALVSGKLHDAFIVTRPDIEILEYHPDQFRKLWEYNTALVTFKYSPQYIIDQCFVFHRQIINKCNVFHSYLRHCLQFPDICPENFWWLHLTQIAKIKLQNYPAIKFHYRHIKSQYCGCPPCQKEFHDREIIIGNNLLHIDGQLVRKTVGTWKGQANSL